MSWDTSLEATEAQFLLVKLKSELTGEKSEQVRPGIRSSRCYFSRITFKTEAHQLTPVSIPMPMPDKHIWNNIPFQLISCAFTYEKHGLACHTQCALHSSNSCRECKWKSNDYQQMDDNNHLSTTTYAYDKTKSRNNSNSQLDNIEKAAVLALNCF